MTRLPILGVVLLAISTSGQWVAAEIGSPQRIEQDKKEATDLISQVRERVARSEQQRGLKTPEMLELAPPIATRKTRQSLIRVVGLEVPESEPSGLASLVPPEVDDETDEQKSAASKANGPSLSAPKQLPKPTKAGRYLVPAAIGCPLPGGKSLTSHSDSLFAPLSMVRLTGNSTSPLKTGDEKDVRLERPDSEGCAYLGIHAPSYYLTSTMIGMQAPYRTAYPLCYRPLYFEDPNLERCGRSYGCLTTARSAGLFAVQIAALPIHMLIDCPRDRVRALPDCPTCHKFGFETYSPAYREMQKRH